MPQKTYELEFKTTMLIKDLKLTNYRNHKNLKQSFDKKLTLITGPNGSGKTNILEAVYLLATAKSPRTKYDKDLITHNRKQCVIDGNIQTQTDEHQLQLQIKRSETYENASSKKARINKVPKSIQKFTGIFNAVLFSPQDIHVLTGSPSEKRKYMDLLLSQINSDYKKNLSIYTKALRQRNKVLEMIRDENRGFGQIEYWNKKILESGEILQKYRDELFEFLQPKLYDLIQHLNGKKTHTKLTYKKNEISKARLEKYKEKEIAATNTLIGPHRDEFLVFMDGYDISEFGSRGQQRTVLLGLKLAEIDYITETKGERPVLLLDDIFSELDEEHRESVFDVIEKQQTIITRADPNINIPSDVSPKDIVLNGN